MLEYILPVVCCFWMFTIRLFYRDRPSQQRPFSTWWPFSAFHEIPPPTSKAKLEPSSGQGFDPDIASNQSKIRRGYELVGKDGDTDGQKTITEYQEEHTGKWFVKSKLIKVGYTEEDLEEMRQREIRKKSKKR